MRTTTHQLQHIPFLICLCFGLICTYSVEAKVRKTDDPCAAQPGFSSLQPVISLGSNPNELSCDIDNATYAWYLDGVLLPNDSTQRITGRQSGTYEVIAIRSGCASLRSLGYAFTLSNSYERIGGNYIWYFGQNAGLDFRTVPPTPLLDGALNTSEGCATISDADGNLLFYTDGLSVWNRNHVVMPNGTGLLGDPSASQSSVVVPHPGNPDQYFILTVPAREVDLNIGLRYTVVDMTADSGFGDVLSKNDSLCAPITEKVTSVVHQNESDIWIITHLWNSDAFYAFLIDDTGIQTTPVISNVGSVHDGIDTNAPGYLKASVDGTKIALARQVITLSTPLSTFPSMIEIFDFDATTGMISNPIQTPDTYNQLYGLEFSPDSKKLYFANNPPLSGFDPMEIYQIDLEAGSPTDVLNSTTLIGTHPKTPSSLFAGALQLGRDSRIYVSIVGSGSLGVIESPNLSGAAANYIPNGVSLGGRTAFFGLPNFIYSAQSLGEPLAAVSIQAFAIENATHIQLNWRTSHPDEFDAFILERSNDGITFQELGRMTPQEGVFTYQFQDWSGWGSVHVLYYRIRGVTAEEDEVISNLFGLTPENKQTENIQLSPNPIPSGHPLSLRFSGSIQQEVRLTLLDINGTLRETRVIQPKDIEQGEFSWQLDKILPRGVFIFQARSVGFKKVFTERLIIN